MGRIETNMKRRTPFAVNRKSSSKRILDVTYSFSLRGGEYMLKNTPGFFRMNAWFSMAKERP